MTLEEYINNPMGSSVVANQREMYKAYYTKKYDALMVRENGKIEYKLYKSKKEDTYVVYLKIPSEAVADFYYDVVIEFKSKNASKLSNLEKYDIRVFSNDPSFVFTFAYAFNKDKMFITELSSKMSKKALTDKAKEKNPQALIGYVKSLYFAYLYMKKVGLVSKLRYAGAEELNYNKLSKEIIHVDEKISLREEEQEKKKRKKKNETHKNTVTKSLLNNPFVKTANVIKTNTISNVNKIVSKTKSVKKIK